MEMVAAISNPNWIRTATIAALASVVLHALVLFSVSRVKLDVHSPGIGRFGRVASSVLVLPVEAPPVQAPPPVPPPPTPPKPPPPVTPAKSDTAPPEVTIVPGIDESSAKTKAWLGFAEATPHQMTPGSVEQSALTPTPGAPVPPGATSEAVPAQAPAVDATAKQSPSTDPVRPVETPAVTPQPQSPPPTLAADAPNPTPPKEPAPADRQRPLPPDPSAREDGKAVPDPGEVREGPRESPGRDDRERPGAAAAPQTAPGETDTPSKRQRAPESAPPPTPRTPEQPEVRLPSEATPPASVTAPTSAPTPAPTGPVRIAAKQSATPGAAVTGERPALRSESEADGTSLDRAVPYRMFLPGQVLARKGLRVFTVRPQFSLTTQVLGLARNAYVKVRFRRDGRVKDADFVDGIGTGNESVDGPLKFALYNWTAKGAELDRLPAGDPEATVSMVLKIVFHEEADESTDDGGDAKGAAGTGSRR